LQRELQLKNVEKEKQTNNVDKLLLIKLDKEKLISEEMHLKHVHVELNFLKNAKTISIAQDVQEFTTDAQEDVWEEHAKLVQELLVQLLNLLINSV